MSSRLEPPIGDGWLVLGQRLQGIGLYPRCTPRQDRSTAAFTLATELQARFSPALLDIHIRSPSNGNIRSQRLNTHAVDISRRARRPTP